MLTQTKIWNRLIVTASPPTVMVAGSSPMGNLSRILIDGLEVTDLEEGRVDLLHFQKMPHPVVDVGAEYDVLPIRLRVRDPHWRVAGLFDEPSLLSGNGSPYCVSQPYYNKYIANFVAIHQDFAARGAYPPLTTRA